MFGKWISKYNSLILLITFFLCGWAIFLFPTLKTDVDFKQFFPKGEPALANYEKFTKTMGSSENILVIAIENKASIFDSLFLKKIVLLQNGIDEFKEIKNSVSILSLKKYKSYGQGFIEKRSYIESYEPQKMRYDSIQIFRDFEVTQHFITKDAKSIKIILQLSDNLSLIQMDALVKKVDNLVNKLMLQDQHYFGRKYLESEYKKLVNEELKISLILSFTFVFFILFLIHRSIIGALLPLICMAVSLIMLYGYMALFNRSLTIMSNLFPTIVLIVGISDVIHISNKFAYESIKNDSVFAINKTVTEIGLTTFINSFTTAIGFLTLLTMSMETMQSFGVDAAVGLMICWVNSIILFPAILLKFNLAKSFRKPVMSHEWNTILTRVLEFTYLHSKKIILAFLIITLVSIYGIFKVNTNNYILSSLPKNNRLFNDFRFFDNNMGGGRTFELIINTKNNHSLHDKKVIQNIEKLENYLKHDIGVSEIISPVLMYKWINESTSRNSNWQLPTSQKDFDRLYLYSTARENDFPIAIIDSTNKTGRLIGRIKDIGRNKMEKKEELIKKWVTRNIDSSNVSFEFTGPDYMTDIGHQLRINNTLDSFMFEILIVSLIIGLIYRSLIMIIISFVSNIIPIIIIGGFLGYSGIEFRGATTIIFAIGYVIAVDDTLHFINRFQLEKRNGLTTQFALEKTYLHTGRAMIMTSLILLGGFIILLHSSFNDVFIHGLLMSLIIIVALVTEFLITPILITSFYKNKL